MIDAGVSVDPEASVMCAVDSQAAVTAISTYNGVALSYAKAISNLPVDVSQEIKAPGYIPCNNLDDNAGLLW